MFTSMIHSHEEGQVLVFQRVEIFSFHELIICPNLTKISFSKNRAQFSMTERALFATVYLFYFISFYNFDDSTVYIWYRIRFIMDGNHLRLEWKHQPVIILTFLQLEENLLMAIFISLKKSYNLLNSF